MPLIQVSMLEGRSDEQKAALIGALTDACVTAIGAAVETVTVVITDVPATHWGVMGRSIKQRRAEAAGNGG
ncbi:MAG TPA: 4-oxalocrotonate tautomerase family protein [Caulobacteraceae bacterium]|jgi:4-oxalocrotonate tautomerase|nr:4-oxalocrotonate tautomerase family protein [Caulobacteraceae bacterium]